MNKLSTHLVNQGFFWQPDAEMYTNTSRWFLNCVSDLKKLSENVRPPNRLGANTGPLMKMDGIFRSYVKFRWCTPQKSSKKREEKKTQKHPAEVPVHVPLTNRLFVLFLLFSVGKKMTRLTHHQKKNSIERQWSAFWWSKLGMWIKMWWVFVGRNVEKLTKAFKGVGVGLSLCLDVW